MVKWWYGVETERILREAKQQKDGGVGTRSIPLYSVTV